MNDRVGISGRFVIGAVLLALGVLWTLDNLNLLDASLVTRWWGLVPLAWGAMCFTGILCARRRWLGLFWLLIGTVALLSDLHMISMSVFDLWPLGLIFLGATIVFRHLRGGGGAALGVGDHRTEQSTINTFALWAGLDHKVVSQAFRGGEVNAVMGGVSVDLRAAQLEGGRATLELFTMWGGIEIVVPTGWRVQSQVTPILGGFEDSTVPPTDPHAAVLVLHGLVVMGGIEVSNESHRQRDVTIVRSRNSRRGERHRSVIVGLGPGSVRVTRERESSSSAAAPAPAKPVEPE